MDKEHTNLEYIFVGVCPPIESGNWIDYKNMNLIRLFMVVMGSPKHISFNTWGSDTYLMQLGNGFSSKRNGFSYCHFHHLAPSYLTGRSFLESVSICFYFYTAFVPISPTITSYNTLLLSKTFREQRCLLLIVYPFFWILCQTKNVNYSTPEYETAAGSWSECTTSIKMTQMLRLLM